MNLSCTDAPTIRWWQALNPAIYLVSILPGIAVWLLAPSPISHSALWPATFAVVLLQHGINLLNDAKDWQLGADTEKHESWVRVHHGNVSTAFYHGLVSLISGGILGLLVLAIHQQLWILGFTLPLVILGILYNAGHRPLSYTAAGEWATALCYGPGVFGGLWFVGGQIFGWPVIFGMTAFAAFSTALLFSHQPPQIKTDREAGKNSFAVRFGEATTYRVSNILLSLSLLLLTVVCWVSCDRLTATVFTMGSVTGIFWVIQTGPSPKRILLSSSLVFFTVVLVSTVPVMF